MKIKLILQGFIVGIGKIIPGVSGAMLAMFMGIYEDLMEAVTRFFDDKKHHFLLLLNFGIGLFLAIVLFSKVILFLLNHYYEETIYLFLGLIMGTVLRLRKVFLFMRKINIFFSLLFYSCFFFLFYKIRIFMFFKIILFIIYMLSFWG